jgi:hypothetical protein
MNRFTIEYHGPHGGDGKKVVMIASPYVVSTNEEAIAAANDPEVWKASGRTWDPYEGKTRPRWKLAAHWIIYTEFTGKVEFDNPHINGRGQIIWLMESNNPQENQT